MLESFPVILIVSTLLGFLAGLGIGGGSLLILWLTMVLGMEHTVARGINLLFFLPAAVIACFFRWKQGSIDWKLILPAILSGCLAAALFSWLGTVFDTGLLKKLFGGLLILTGIRELLYRERN
ncbi:MAG: TSUP family transporter [Oscillospiraceae bacterium]|nr:TSUP family transporter [Oscillospiraceae bacterium]